MIRRPFVVKYKAPLRAEKKTFRRDRARRTFNQADLACPAFVHHAWFAPGVFLTRHVRVKGRWLEKAPHSRDIANVIPPILGKPAAHGQGFLRQFG